MSSQRSSSSTALVVAATASVATLAAGFYVLRGRRSMAERGTTPERPPIFSVEDWNSFQEAARTLRNTNHPLENGDKLILYALYKQTIVGDAPPNFTLAPHKKADDDFMIEQAKYASWCDVRGMERIAALKYYISAAQEFTSPSLEASSVSAAGNEEQYQYTDGFNAGGAAVSTPLVDVTAIDTSTTGGQLLAAASQNDIEKLRALLDEEGLDKNHADASGQTALHLAADRGSAESVQLLIQAGCTLDAVDRDGISVLHAAVIGGNVETVQLLLKAGANPDQEDCDGDTPRSCSRDDPRIGPLFDLV